MEQPRCGSPPASFSEPYRARLDRVSLGSAKGQSGRAGVSETKDRPPGPSPSRRRRPPRIFLRAVITRRTRCKRASLKWESLANTHTAMPTPTWPFYFRRERDSWTAGRRRVAPNLPLWRPGPYFSAALATTVPSSFSWGCCCSHPASGGGGRTGRLAESGGIPRRRGGNPRTCL